MKEIVSRVKPYIPTVIGGVLGALIVHFRGVIYEAVSAIADAVPDDRADPKTTLVVDEDLLRAVREDGAILVYKSNGHTDNFAIIHDPDKY